MSRTEPRPGKIIQISCAKSDYLDCIYALDDAGMVWVKKISATGNHIKWEYISNETAGGHEFLEE